MAIPLNSKLTLYTLNIHGRVDYGNELIIISDEDSIKAEERCKLFCTINLCKQIIDDVNFEWNDFYNEAYYYEHLSA